jgi:hypothetical protein
MPIVKSKIHNKLIVLCGFLNQYIIRVADGDIKYKQLNQTIIIRAILAATGAYIHLLIYKDSCRFQSL